MSQSEIHFTGRLRFDSAVHVGAGRGHAGVDAPLRRNARGDVLIPGTAIAGVLRGLATRLLEEMDLGHPTGCIAMHPDERSLGVRSEPTPCGCPVCELFGDRVPAEPANDDDAPIAYASRLWVYDASLEQDVAPFVRDGVGIDRASRTSARASRAKHDMEILPAGTTFSLRLRFEQPDAIGSILLAAVLSEWRAGRAWLGGSTARGLGRATLEHLEVGELTIDSPEDVVAWLRADDRTELAREQPGWLTAHRNMARARWKDEKPTGNSGPAWIELDFDLDIDGPFITNDPTAAIALGVDHAPLLDAVSGEHGQRSPLLPGSGLRGALRSHAERIARTILTHQVATSEEFLKRCPACDPNADRLAGSEEEWPLARCDKRRKDEFEDLDAESEDLCLACRLFGSTLRGSRLRIVDSPLDGDARWKILDFLAIDRFTGGALDGAKFDALALLSPCFKGKIFLESPERWEVGWLALVLRDLRDGMITVGMGAAKGFGRASASNFRARVGVRRQPIWGIERDPDPDSVGVYDEWTVGPDVDAPVRSLVLDAVAEAVDTIENFEGAHRERTAHPKADTYPDELRTLYPPTGGLHARG